VVQKSRPSQRKIQIVFKFVAGQAIIVRAPYFLHVQDRCLSLAFFATAKGVGTIMDIATKTTTTKSVGSSKTDATQAFRAMAENGAQETLEKMRAVTAETTTLIQDCCSTAVKGAQDYNAKFIEFARANTEAAFEFAQKLSSVKSPSEFFESSTNHSRKQFDILTEQARELTALAQKVTLATTEPLKTGVTKAFSKLS
jgi:phasin